MSSQEDQATPASRSGPRRLGVVGTGMIGGSFALATRRVGLFDEILGYDAGEEILSRALAAGVVDRCCHSIAELAASSHVVLVAVPVDVAAVCVAECMQENVELVMDAGSVKQGLLEALAGPDIERLVSVHPIAGTHLSGPEAAREDMFSGSPLIVMSEGREDVKEEARRLWEACGAVCLEMDSSSHDRLLALTSHLPHLLAFCYMGVVGHEPPESLSPLLGPGFRDFTRIAQGDAKLWDSIFSANRKELLRIIDAFQSELGRMRGDLSESETLEESLREANRRLRVLR